MRKHRRTATFLCVNALLASAALLGATQARANEGAAALRLGRNSVVSPEGEATFRLTPNRAVLNCLAEFPDDPTRPPTAVVRVIQGDLNDRLIIRLHNIKPGLAFDLFTVERSRFLADGTPDPDFHGFGLSWYQSDLQADEEGEGGAIIRTILVNQIFGFVDPASSGQLPPTNTFHVGFWFNDPNDVAACINPPPVTPFNGEHHAGPLAMISLPDAETGLGPLCLNPDTSTTPAHCNP